MRTRTSTAITVVISLFDSYSFKSIFLIISQQFTIPDETEKKSGTRGTNYLTENGTMWFSFGIIFNCKKFHIKTVHWMIINEAQNAVTYRFKQFRNEFKVKVFKKISLLLRTYDFTNAILW